MSNNIERETKAMETLKYCKVRKVKTPTRAHATDAGIDFFVPEDLTAEVMAKKCETTGCDVEMELADDGKTVKCFILKPNESILIPSGIKMKVPEGYMLQYNNKSGVASKRGLLVGACVSANTLIETNKGFFRAVDLTKDFCDRNEILVKSFDLKTKKMVFKKCDGFRQVAKTKIIKITFEDGSSIEGDENHLIWTGSCWKALSEF